MGHVNYKECIAAGFSEEEILEVEKIAKGISKYAKRSAKLGITIFGGSSGSLRKKDGRCDGRSIILASLSEPSVWDGGCGACCEDEDGILRGE